VTAAVFPAVRPRTGAQQPVAKHAIRELLGESPWRRLPEAVRARFADPARRIDYCGSFDVVRASLLGRLLAALCRCLGTPVAPRTGFSVPALVRVIPTPSGIAWQREYRWSSGAVSRVCSTKTVGADGSLIERLPAGLCMPLNVFESNGVLHFASCGYYFDWGIPFTRLRLKWPLPRWLSPGITHVEHVDESSGWFRFTLSVTHPRCGEIFYQTGRFRATGGVP
jgi:hypothetical protein